jgi:hypothetical protein
MNNYLNLLEKIMKHFVFIFIGLASFSVKAQNNASSAMFYCDITGWFDSNEQGELILDPNFSIENFELTSILSVNFLQKQMVWLDQPSNIMSITDESLDASTFVAFKESGMERLTLNIQDGNLLIDFYKINDLGSMDYNLMSERQTFECVPFNR